jgi:hypothetical protein
MTPQPQARTPPSEAEGVQELSEGLLTYLEPLKGQQITGKGLVSQKDLQK